MTGGGIGGVAGTALGAALAPETGGLSLAIPAALGAGGAFLGDKITGTGNPLRDALMAGVLGGVTGGVEGGGDITGIGADNGITGASEGSQALTGAENAVGYTPPPNLASYGVAQGAQDAGTSSAADEFAGFGNYGTGANGSGSSILSNIGKNPLPYALTAATAAPLVNQLLNPAPKFNVAGNRASVLAGDPGFNGSLPKYNLQNNGTPYTGNWYTYGAQPNAPMYSGSFVPAKRGGMMTHERVRHYAVGGPVMPMPGQSPMQAPNPLGPPPQQPPMQQPQMGTSKSAHVNPLAIQAAHRVGVAIGQHLKKHMMTPPGAVKGAGGGQDDAIPARLSDGEFVIPADIVSGLGDGSSTEGSKKLHGLMKHVRAHKTSHKSQFPPKAHNPLSYLPKKGSA